MEQAGQPVPEALRKYPPPALKQGDVDYPTCDLKTFKPSATAKITFDSDED